MVDMTKQVPLRLPDELAAKVDERAALVGLSRNAWLVAVVERAVEQPVSTHTRKQRI